MRRRDLRGATTDRDEVHQKYRARAEGTTSLGGPTALDWRGLGNHQADLVFWPGEDIMNLFYPSCLTSSYSLSLGNITRNATTTQIPFLPNPFSLYRILCTLCCMWMRPSSYPNYYFLFF